MLKRDENRPLLVVVLPLYEEATTQMIGFQRLFLIDGNRFNRPAHIKCGRVCSSAVSYPSAFATNRTEQKLN